jgi:stage V sporulation protein R
MDLLQFLMENSTFLNEDENIWMKSVMQIVRKTSLFFQPQIRTKIMNEGWASFWHETLFLQDERIAGHEVDFARVNAAVTSLPRVGLNPYALGMRMFSSIEEMADKGQYAYEFQRILDDSERKRYDKNTGNGREFIFHVRQNFCDAMFVSTFLDQDFMTRHNLFVAAKRLNKERMVWEYYIKSRKLEDYKKMIQDSLYHPPHITVDTQRMKEGKLYLVHHFEGKPLLNEFIANTMMGIEYLWGKPVQLETSEVVSTGKPQTSPWVSPLTPPAQEETKAPEIKWRRVLYTMEKRKLTKKEM